MTQLLRRFWLPGLLLLGQGACRQIPNELVARSPNPDNFKVNYGNEICLTYLTTILVKATDAPGSAASTSAGGGAGLGSTAGNPALPSGTNTGATPGSGSVPGSPTTGGKSALA